MRMFAGLLSRMRAPPRACEMRPNLVASTTWSRWPLMARPMSSSLMNGPYVSAVSRKVTPRSSARWMVRMDSASSVPAPV